MLERFRVSRCFIILSGPVETICESPHVARKSSAAPDHHGHRHVGPGTLCSIGPSLLSEE